MTINQGRIATPDHEAPAAMFEVTTRANKTQKRALDLMGEIGNLSQPASRLEAERQKPKPQKPLPKQHTSTGSGGKLQSNGCRGNCSFFGLLYQFCDFIAPVPQ